MDCFGTYVRTLPLSEKCVGPKKSSAATGDVTLLYLLMVQKSGRKPVEAGSLSHYLQGFMYQVVGNGISEPSTVSFLSMSQLSQHLEPPNFAT